MLEWTGAGVKCWSSHRATSTLKTSPVTISRVQELEVIYTGLNNLAWTLTLLHEVNFDNLFKYYRWNFFIFIYDTFHVGIIDHDQLTLLDTTEV